jgi:hypothetical protein
MEGKVQRGKRTDRKSNRLSIYSKNEPLRQYIHPWPYRQANHYILLEIADDSCLDTIKQRMLSIGYLFSPQPNNPPPCMMFMKGYTPRGFEGQAFHVHVRYSGDWDELHFRDYLLCHPEVASEYSELKKQLSNKFEFDRDGYTEAKSDFIRRITALARQEQKNNPNSPTRSCAASGPIPSKTDPQ